MPQHATSGSFVRQPDQEKRFWSKVSKGPPGACWEWTGAKNSGGYGIYEDGRTLNAHRIAYERLVGPISHGLHLDHLCRNRGCVNPAHLDPVTAKENIRRAAMLRTTCPAGHPYDYMNTEGARACKKCLAAASARWYAKRKAARLVP